LAERGFSPLDFKMWVLQGHFQGTRNFSFTDLTAAKNRLLNWRNKAAEAYQLKNIAKTTVQEKILESLNENLNSPEAFSVIDTNELSFEDWQYVDERFGLKITDDIKDAPKDITDLLEKRDAARKNKDYETADKIRDILDSKNFVVKDTKAGPVWQFKN
jgi:cysteinyl-tRNA synthetase